MFNGPTLRYDMKIVAGQRRLRWRVNVGDNIADGIGHQARRHGYALQHYYAVRRRVSALGWLRDNGC